MLNQGGYEGKINDMKENIWEMVFTGGLVERDIG